MGGLLGPFLWTISCLAGIGCLVGAVVAFVLAAQGKRETGVEQYEQAVEAWTERHRKQFHAAATVGVVARVPGRSETVAALGLVSEPDPFRGTEQGLDLPSYEALMFRAGLEPPSPRWHMRSTDGRNRHEPPFKPGPALPTGFIRSVAVENLTLKQSLEQWGPVVHLKFQVGPSVVDTDPLPLVRAVAHHEGAAPYNHCHSRGGVQEAVGVCWEVQRLAAVCMQVALQDGVWRLAARENASYGCQFDRGRWTPGVYSTIKLSRTAQRWEGTTNLAGVLSAANLTVDFGDLAVELRSSLDPLFGAMTLTNGSMDFGWSSFEEDVLGMVLLVMGCGFVSQATCRLCWKSWRQRRSNSPGMRHAGRTPRLSMGVKERQLQIQKLRLRDPDPQTLGANDQM